MVEENHLNRQKMPCIISACLKKLVVIENVEQPHQELKKNMFSFDRALQNSTNPIFFVDEVNALIRVLMN